MVVRRDIPEPQTITMGKIGGSTNDISTNFDKNTKQMTEGEIAFNNPSSIQLGATGIILLLAIIGGLFWLIK